MTVTTGARHRSLRARARHGWCLAPVVMVVAVGCGSGRSILEAGNEPVTTLAVTTTTERVGATVPPGTVPPGNGQSATTAPSAPPTVPPTVPPTTEAPLDAYPPCPTDALAAATGPIEVTYWHGMNAVTEDALQQLTEQYNASQTRVVVHLENQGGYQEVLDKYYQSGADSRPDMLMFPEYGFQQAIDSGTFVPVGACLESSGFDTSTLLPQAVRAYAQGGVQWAFPFNVSNVVLYYNKVVFAAAGLDPERPPITMAELRDYCQQIVTTGAATFGLAYDTNFDGGGGWYIEQWFANSGALYADNLNGRQAPATAVLIDSPAGQQIFSELQALEAEGLLVNVGDNPSGTDALLKLADEDAPAAMSFGSSASLGTVIDAIGSGLVPGVGIDDVGVGPLPSFGDQPAALVGGAANYIVAGQPPEVTAAAWDFMEFLVSPEAQSVWAAATGYVPIADGANDIEPLKSVYANDARFRVAYDQVVNAPVDAPRAGAVLGPHRQIRTIQAGALAAIFEGADVAGELSNATAQANALLQQYAALNQP